MPPTERASQSSNGLADRLACADSTFPRLSHLAALTVIRDLGIPAVDICVFAGYEHTLPREVVADPASSADAVRARLEETGLRVSDVFAILGTSFDDLAVNHPDATVRAESLAQFRQVLDFASRLGAPGVTILPGIAFEGEDPRESLERSAGELQRRAELAGAADLRLSVEPHYGSIAQSPSATVELLEVTPDLTLSLDYSHFVFQGIDQAEVDPLIDRSRHVHLRQAGEGVMQAPTDEGEIDFRRLLNMMERAGYEGYLALEYQCEEWLDCRRVDCITETAELRDLLLGAATE